MSSGLMWGFTAWGVRLVTWSFSHGSQLGITGNRRLLIERLTKHPIPNVPCFQRPKTDYVKAPTSPLQRMYFSSPLQIVTRQRLA